MTFHIPKRVFTLAFVSIATSVYSLPASALELRVADSSGTERLVADLARTDRVAIAVAAKGQGAVLPYGAMVQLRSADGTVFQTRLDHYGAGLFEGVAAGSYVVLPQSELITIEQLALRQDRSESNNTDTAKAKDSSIGAQELLIGSAGVGAIAISAVALSSSSSGGSSSELGLNQGSIVSSISPGSSSGAGSSSASASGSIPTLSATSEVISPAPTLPPISAAPNPGRPARAPGRGSESGPSLGSGDIDDVPPAVPTPSPAPPPSGS